LEKKVEKSFHKQEENFFEKGAGKSSICNGPFGAFSIFLFLFLPFQKKQRKTCSFSKKAKKM
jgi:hypothetical protein